MAAIGDDDWPDIEAAVSGALTERGLGDVVRDVYEVEEDDGSAQRRTYALLEAARRFFEDRAELTQQLSSSMSELGIERVRFVDEEEREVASVSSGFDDEAATDRATAEALQGILGEIGEPG